MNIYLDIETIGKDSSEIRADLALSLKPPGNIKKPESIAKWEAEERPALIDEAIKKTSFDGSVGQIVCIGWALNDEKPQSFCSPAEKSLITEFYNWIGHVSALFIGHNISSFDLRFLWQRSVIHGLTPPHTLKAAMKAKPWSDSIADTMVMWNPDRDKRISLERLCKALGVVSPKSDMDGSRVWEEFNLGHFDKIQTYCKGDIEATRACYKKMVFQ